MQQKNKGGSEPRLRSPRMMTSGFEVSEAGGSAVLVFTQLDLAGQEKPVVSVEMSWALAARLQRALEEAVAAQPEKPDPT